MNLSALSRLSYSVAAVLSAATLLLDGCVSPGYPYNGSVPYSTAVPPAYPPSAVPVAPAVPYPYVYAPAPVLIAPTFYAGWGTGYWYGGRFWPYRAGCAFYGGRYYGGYRHNYWRRGHGTWCR